MSKITIGENRISFEKDGKPFFYFADTMWSAFTNVTDQEWGYYLKKRAEQGFNVLQMNILPQWDRCWVPSAYAPFPSKDGNRFDYAGGFVQEYFDHARDFCKKAVEKGFVPALVVLWSNYVPGTWASKANPHNMIPEELIVPYCKKVAETFDEFEPIYIISGDTDLESEESIRYYETALAEMKRLSPDTLKTAHIKGRYTYLTEGLAEGLDFYVFQSGHNNGYPEKPYSMPQEFREKYPLKPLINAEPCYEQISYSGGMYGRFDTHAIRRAAWMSVLSGANAGIAYGAHGVWNWQKTGMPFNPNVGEGFDEAKVWEEALNFPGAWDYSYLKYLLEELDVSTLQPDTRVISRTSDIRMATSGDGRISLVYIPHNTKVCIQENLSGARVYAVELSTRYHAVPEVSIGEDETTTIGMCSFDRDVLLVIRR